MPFISVSSGHNAGVAHIDQVLGPDDDTVTFFQPRAMVFVTMLWVVTAVWVLALGLLALIRYAIGTPPDADDLTRYLEAALIVPVVVTATILLLAWRPVAAKSRPRIELCSQPSRRQASRRMVAVTTAGTMRAASR